MSFDHADFVANPNKYRLFQTATVAGHIFTENGENDLPAGERVNIRFMRTAYNPLRRRDEPVYGITADNAKWNLVYASNLTRFVL